MACIYQQASTVLVYLGEAIEQEIQSSHPDHTYTRGAINLIMHLAKLGFMSLMRSDLESIRFAGPHKEKLRKQAIRWASAKKDGYRGSDLFDSEDLARAGLNKGTAWDEVRHILARQ